MEKIWKNKFTENMGLMTVNWIWGYRKFACSSQIQKEWRRVSLKANVNNRL